MENLKLSSDIRSVTFWVIEIFVLKWYNLSFIVFYYYPILIKKLKIDRKRLQIYKFYSKMFQVDRKC